MTSGGQDGPSPADARRRSEVRKAGGQRRVGRAIEAQRGLSDPTNPPEDRAPATDSEGRQDAERRLNEVAHAVRDHEDTTRQEVGPESSADRRLYHRLRQALRR